MSVTGQTIKIYMRENMRNKRLFFPALLLWTGGILLQKLMMPFVVAKAFDKIVSNAGQVRWEMFQTDLIVFIALALTAQACIDIALVVLSKLETIVTPALHTRVYDYLINQSNRFHANSFSGSLVTQTNRFVNAYVAITDLFVMNITQIIVLVVLSSAVVAFYAPLLAAVIFSWSVIFIFLNYRYTKKRIAYSKAAAAAETKLTGYLADSVTNVNAVKSFANEVPETRQFTDLAEDRAHKKYEYWLRSIKNDAFFGIMMSALQIIVLATSIFLIQRGSVTVGVLVLAQVYITQIIGNMWGLSGMMRNIEQHLSDAAEMTEILSHPIKVVDKPGATELQATKGAIVFDSVTFSHADSTDALFKKLNLTITPGEKVGLVGASGGGKTTLTKILLRFADIDGGQILIDGQNIADVTQNSLRKAITYVPQEPLLFHRSLSENIAYSNLSASKAEITKIAKLAHAHEFIKDLPRGYDTPVGERGVKLSGGQRQRVAIARAMIKEAPILVLDEATSALDSESEVLIQDALWKLMEGRTAIVIAHRLSTIQKMDRILVMDKGKIVEEGTHKELLRKKDGIYAKLWNHQSGGFLED